MASAAKNNSKKKTTKRTTGKSSNTRTQTARKSTAKKKTGYSSAKKSKSTGNAKSSAGRKTGTGRIPVSTPKDYSVLKDILIIAVSAVSLFLLISCFVSNGTVMFWMHYYNFSIFGIMAYVIPFLLFFLTCFIMSNWGNPGLFTKILAIALTFFSISAIFSILHKTDAIDAYGGGLIGDSIVDGAVKYLGLFGTYVLMAALIMISLVLFFGHPFVEGIQNHSQNAYNAVYSKHRIYKGEREIRAKQRQLYREQLHNEKLEKQKEQLAYLEEEKQREIRRGYAIREFNDITLEETMPPEIKENTRKRKEPKAKKVYLTNAELELQDRSMKEVTVKDEPEKMIAPKVTIEGKDVTDDFDTYFTGEPESDKSDDYTSDNQDEYTHDIISDVSSADFNDNDPAVDFPSESISEPVKLDTRKAVSKGDSAFEMDEIFSEDDYPDISSDSTEEEISGDYPDSSSADEAYMDDSYTDDADEEKKYTKTVRTASGKVITVDLDGLPGENKRPRDPVRVQTRLDQYDEKIVPVNYEEPKEYVFPPISLLKPGSTSSAGRDELARGMKETAVKLQKTLQEFKVGVTVTNISRGPSVTRYELQPEQGVKVSRITNLADDIKLNLAAEDIRIEAPIPGKAAIGIEIPNKEKQAVAFRDLIESDEFRNHKSKTIFAAGKDIAGKTVIADIEKMPHLLIAGATGSGKSVCINTIIMSILYKAKPSEVKLIMIDPKVVELSVYNGIPHLLIPVVTDPKKAAAALNWAVNEMEERYRKFSELKTRNIVGYNAAIDQIKDVPGEDRPKKIPQIVVIVDELADLIMSAASDVEDAIQRLAQKARAAGIHLIIATQRPSVNVITGVIKANIPSRIAFSVSSSVDSRTIIDMQGAEKLLGKGDMLFYPYYVSKPMRVQGAFVSDEEVSEVTDFLVKQKNVIGGEIDTSIDLKASATGSKAMINNDRDELFATAGSFIIEQDKASIGNLQRHLRIGFNRAARIMDQLYEAGVVSKDDGTKARKVLMSMEKFDELLTEMDS